jgi:GNAT superfamily N-acetyltransferase
VDIQLFDPNDDAAASRLRDLMINEGDEWEHYHSEEGWPQYREALAASTTWVAEESGETIGFARVHKDNFVMVLVLDLLVRKDQRGRSIGKALLSAAADAYPGMEVYVLSDSDGYYEKAGFEKIGSIFQIR